MPASGTRPLSMNPKVCTPRAPCTHSLSVHPKRAPQICTVSVHSASTLIHSLRVCTPSVHPKCTPSVYPKNTSTSHPELPTQALILHTHTKCAPRACTPNMHPEQAPQAHARACTPVPITTHALRIPSYPGTRVPLLGQQPQGLLMPAVSGTANFGALSPCA